MTGVRTYFAMAALTASMAVWPAHAQQPSQAEKDAIRSNCRSDFMSKCSSVTPGGAEAFQCLKKNEATLLGGCRAAVSAIKLPGETPAAAPAAPKPAAAAPAPAPAATAPKPAEPAPAVAIPAKPEAPKAVQTKPVTPPKPVVATAPAAPAPVAAPPATAPGPKLTPLQEARLVRMFCTVDFQTLCKGVRIGEGRVLKCLSDNQPALSPGCKGAMAKVQ